MASKIKAPAVAISVPQSKDECASYIKDLGDVQRDLARAMTDLNDEIADLTLHYEQAIEARKTRIKALQAGIQTWCEANRATLCADGSKTANLVTGEVNWRIRPPSVRISGVDSVLETLALKGLTRFIRTRQEPNKDAMLNEPEVVRGIAGISIVSGVEDFGITPFEVPEGQP